MDNITLVAIGLAKNSFHLRGVNHKGRAILNRKAEVRGAQGRNCLWGGVIEDYLHN